MDLVDAETTARALMARHGLDGWGFGWDAAVRRAGATHYRDRRITLSRKLTRLHDEALVRDTVLHEIAHALVGPGHGHDAVWRRRATAIGASGERCLAPDAPAVEGRWRGTCPAGHVVTRHRAPVRVASCPRCAPRFDLAHVYTWTRDGHEVPMGERYAAELRRLRRDGRAGHAGGAAQEARGEADRRPAAALGPGDRVRLAGSGRYAGRRGTVVARRRTRYLVDLGGEQVTVPFALALPT